MTQDKVKRVMDIIDSGIELDRPTSEIAEKIVSELATPAPQSDAVEETAKLREELEAAKKEIERLNEWIRWYQEFTNILAPKENKEPNI